MDYPVLVLRLIDFLKEIKAKYSEVDTNEIIYANGNDGTDFDWSENNHLCEFGFEKKDGGAWLIKCIVGKQGKASVYYYPNGAFRPAEEISRQLFSPEEMITLYHIMYNSTDKCGLYDVALSEVKWIS